MTKRIEKVKARQRGRKRWVKTPRKVLFFLLSLGVAGVSIGVVLVGAGVLKGKSRLSSMGVIYIAIFLALLLVRAAMIQYDIVRKRRYATGR